MLLLLRLILIPHTRTTCRSHRYKLRASDDARQLAGQLDAHVTYMGHAHMFLVLAVDFNTATQYDRYNTSSSGTIHRPAHSASL